MGHQNSKEMGEELGLNHPGHRSVTPLEAESEVVGCMVLLTSGNGGAVKPEKMLREKRVPSLMTPSKAERTEKLVCALTMAY